METGYFSTISLFEHFTEHFTLSGNTFSGNYRLHWFKDITFGYVRHNCMQLWYIAQYIVILGHFASPWTFPWLPRCAGTLLSHPWDSALPEGGGCRGPSGFEAVVFSTGDSLVAMWCRRWNLRDPTFKHIPRGVSCPGIYEDGSRCLYWMLKYQVQFLLLFQPQNAE